MSGPDIRIVAPEAFGEAALNAFVEVTRLRTWPVAGLATGSTPLPFYAALRDAVNRGALSIANMRAYALDEYAGNPAHPCSNQSYFRREWERAPGAPPVKQFDGGAKDLATEANRYASALDEAGGLDVSLLGIGLNGHVAFNEPGSGIGSTTRVAELAWSTRESARSCWDDATPTFGLTVGMAEIAASKSLLLLASGPQKARIMARALSGPMDSSCPASLLREHPNLVVVLDASAASQLLGGTGPGSRR